MGLLPDAQNCGLRMRRECRERFPCHRLTKRNPLVRDPGIHHGTCVTHVPWCMSGSLTPGGGENVPDIPGACATRNSTYLARDPWNVFRLNEPLCRKPSAISGCPSQGQVMWSFDISAGCQQIFFDWHGLVLSPAWSSSYTHYNI